MWEVNYTKEGIEVRYDDGNDVWLKTIHYSEIVEGIKKAFEEDHYRMAKTMKNSIYGIIKEDNSNETH